MRELLRKIKDKVGVAINDATLFAILYWLILTLVAMYLKHKGNG